MSKSNVSTPQWEAGQPLQKRSVVSNFLFRFCDAEARATKVALFRRSDKVHTYQHHLAPISGSFEPQIDATPVETAWRELKEETSLTSSTVKLWRKGRPFSFEDLSVGREWTIYPFAFLLKPPTECTDLSEKYNSEKSSDDGIVIDWEHDFYNWHDPDEVLSRLEKDGPDATVCGQMLVPRIADSLMSVYPEYNLGPTAGQLLREGLQQLETDHQSGARELAAIALKILKDILVEVRPSRLKETRDNDQWQVWWKKVRLISWHLWINGRESMGAAISSALLSVLANLEPLYENKLLEADINPIIESLIEQRGTTTKRLCESFMSFLRESGLIEKTWQQRHLKIVTLSASSTIRESILQLVKQIDQDMCVELRVLESRPLFEGVTLAGSILSSAQLSQNGSSDDDDGTKITKIHITLFPDSSAAIAARDADILMIGADRIASDGAVSNKTGSLPAILAARYVSPGIKVVVMSEFDKVGGAGEAHLEDEENDPEEVERGWRLAEVAGADKIGTKKMGGREVVAEVRNVYFEWVPPSLIDAYISDDGVKGVSDISERSARVSHQIQRFFNDL